MPHDLNNDFPNGWWNGPVQRDGESNIDFQRRYETWLEEYCARRDNLKLDGLAR